MTVRANKPAFSIREKLKELQKPIGLKGSELMRAETVQDARDLVSAGRRNLVINGAMMINQRYGTSSATVTDAYVLDRFKFKENHGGAASINRDAFPVSDNHPAGFRYAMQVACSTADTSLTSNEHSVIMHMVEGYNIGGTKFGTTNAENMTLSFWVKTNAPGTYSVALKNGDQNRCQIKEYTVGMSGYVWEKVVLTFSGCTDGTWDDGDGIGMKLEFGLAGGQASYATSDLNTWKTSNLFLSTNQRNFFDSTNNRFFITGIQLEIGNNATDFEHRPYGEELALCQRYYWEIGSYVTNNWAPVMLMVGNNATRAFGVMHTPVTMRAHPQVTFSQLNLYDGSSSITVTDLFRYSQTGRNQEYDGLAFEANVASGGTAGKAYRLNIENVSGTSGYIRLNAEL